MVKDRYWENLSLQEMNKEQWEALCDRCGRCCLHKLRDDDTNEIYYTNVACWLLDIKTGQCSDYCHRKIRIPDCIQLTRKNLSRIDWLPSTCAYRLIAEGKTLYPWHYLIAGNFEAMHKAGISVRGKVVSEHDAGELEDYIVEWID
ncbi:YcgN family cysteine cluster protein [Commensalibacter melissae]|uniref:YcgN family cysteine cluster protein n=1 Tax=Commensalibacter melissae TaxID=2070537 RepID=UPI0012D9CAC4|nr:YcgN family cysteine cluster protein [Commensalibacter melissae]MUH07046.1 YcgN family cysteine cluster protein [Commensalibacter melissae]